MEGMDRQFILKNTAGKRQSDGPHLLPEVLGRSFRGEISNLPTVRYRPVHQILANHALSRI